MSESIELSAELSLVSTVQELSSARTVERVAEIVRAAARRLVRADGATFILRDGDLCHYLDEDAIRPLWKGQRFPLESCVSGMAMLTKEAIAIEDIYKDVRVPIRLYEPTFVRSLLMMPVRASEPIAAIGVYWATARTPGVRETELLQALANSTAVALENVALQEAVTAKISELENANRAKDEFLATLSHELRSPMTSVLGWLEILLDPHDPLTEQERRTGLETIRRNAELQMRLVGDILDSSQIVLGKLSVSKQACDLRQLVESTAQAARVDALKRSIYLRAELGPGPLRILGDQDRLQQVLGNLLSNAIKFTSEGGTVLIALEREGRYAKLTVKDTGRGIDPAFLPHIFDRFRQENSAHSRTYGGLGLGLAIAKYVVDSHEGTIRAESAGTGLGTVMTVRLPILAEISSGAPRIGAGQAPALAAVGLAANDQLRG